jgi:hypothetical protein
MSAMSAPIADTSALKDSHPILISGPASSTKRVAFYAAGPSVRTQDLGTTVNVHPAVRFGLEASTPANWYPPDSFIRLETPVTHLQLATGDPTVEILLHYRVIDPEATKLLTDPSGGFIVNRLFAETATTTALTTPVHPAQMNRDTRVELTLNEDFQTACHVILKAVGQAAGLTEFLRSNVDADGKVHKWMWGVYAECALLLERVHAENWIYIRVALQQGGWWLRVYLVETEPQSLNMWATKSPSAIGNATQT